MKFALAFCFVPSVMFRGPNENERGLECAIVKMAFAEQEVELSPADLITMARLTKELQNYLRLADIALRRKQPYRRAATDGNRAATAA